MSEKPQRKYLSGKEIAEALQQIGLLPVVPRKKPRIKP
jgi:hypothetical protein